jgi:dTDP-4-amino-4,6-dideoxygalactose transaminase
VDRVTCKDFTILVDETAFGLSRDLLAESMRRENVDSRRYYDPPCHRMTAYAGLAAGALELPRTERLSKRCLSIPIWSGMDDDTAARICLAIEGIGERAGELRRSAGE